MFEFYNEIIENVPKRNLSFIGIFIYENMHENYRKLHQFITCTKLARKSRCMCLKSKHISKLQLIRCKYAIIRTFSDGFDVKQHSSCKSKPVDVFPRQISNSIALFLQPIFSIYIYESRPSTLSNNKQMCFR